MAVKACSRRSTEIAKRQKDWLVCKRTRWSACGRKVCHERVRPCLGARSHRLRPRHLSRVPWGRTTEIQRTTSSPPQEADALDREWTAWASGRRAALPRGKAQACVVPAITSHHAIRRATTAIERGKSWSFATSGCAGTRIPDRASRKDATCPKARSGRLPRLQLSRLPLEACDRDRKSEKSVRLKRLTDWSVNERRGHRRRVLPPCLEASFGRLSVFDTRQGRSVHCAHPCLAARVGGARPGES